MKNIVGIDLGTTYSAISKLNELGKPEIIPNSDSERITASAIFFGNNQIIVGNYAINSYNENPENLARWFKRDMGEKYYSKKIMKKNWSPIELSSIILKKLKKDFEKKNKNIDYAVISVPAYFDEVRRNATLEAGKKAGLNVIGIVNEPTAAAIYYSKEYNIHGKVMVLDLGGGTFDVTLLDVNGDNIDILCSRGDHRLGGYDFDIALARLVAKKIGIENEEDFVNDSDVLTKIENHKKRLSKFNNTKIQLFWKNNAYQVNISRKEFISAISTYLARIELLAEDTLDEANISKEELDQIIFVGGSTRLPKLKEIIFESFNVEPKIIGNVDECVSLGCSIYAGIKVAKNFSNDVSSVVKNEINKTKVKEVCNHSYGTFSIGFDENLNENKVKNDIIINKNEPIPVTKSKMYYTIRKNQENIKITITQGESEDIDFVNVLHEENMKLPSNRPADRPIKVEFSYNSNQIMECVVTDIESNTIKNIKLKMNKEIESSENSNEEILDLFDIE